MSLGATSCIQEYVHVCSSSDPRRTRPTPHKGYQRRRLDTHLSNPVTQLVGRAQPQERSSSFVVRTGTKMR